MYFDCVQGCAAAFLPEIKRGYAITNLFDDMIFGSELGDKADWETEHNGKRVAIPRPVAALRVWNSETQVFSLWLYEWHKILESWMTASLNFWNVVLSCQQDYEMISPILGGAPAIEDRDSYWQTFLDELRAALNPKYGENFIDDCITLSKDEVKSQYF